MLGKLKKAEDGRVRKRWGRGKRKGEEEWGRGGEYVGRGDGGRELQKFRVKH